MEGKRFEEVKVEVDDSAKGGRRLNTCTLVSPTNLQLFILKVIYYFQENLESIELRLS